MRILVAEDDQNLADAVAQSLRRLNHAVDCVRSGEQADAALAAHRFDLLILDLGLPGKSGLDVLKGLRAHKVAIPILILTARDSLQDRVTGLDAGADDYLAKPFELAELAARVRALSRRSNTDMPAFATFGSLSYDPISRSARLSDKSLDLSAREAGLLEVLLRRAGRLVSKDELVNCLCEWGDEVSANAIEVYVHRLRRKLEPGGVRIATLRGLGYRLEESQPARVRTT